MKTLLCSSLLLAAAPLLAGELEQQVLRCSVLGEASVRLGCYDALAKAATPSTDAAVAKPGPSTAMAGVQPAPSAAPAGPQQTAAAISDAIQHWELDDAARRGRFAFRPHRDNYLLLANYSSASNEQPNGASPSGAFPGRIKSQHVELNYQLSFKMKLVEKAFEAPLDLWFGYTQQSYWQAYNRAASSPFRETNYQPELMAVLPLHANIAGVDLRFVNLGLVHQSNGQTSPLSRSWNRIYAELGAERGNAAVSARLWKRLDNARSDNDNADILDFMGYGDVHATLRDAGHEYSLTARRNLRARHGSLQAGWAFPLSRNLKGYLQAFSGYGQSLIDYNYSQKSIGAGFLIDL